MEKFADVLDQAEAQRGAEIQAILSNRVEYSSGLEPAGFCKYCSFVVYNPKQFFCDST